MYIYFEDILMENNVLKMMTQNIKRYKIIFQARRLSFIVQQGVLMVELTGCKNMIRIMKELNAVST